MTKPDLIQLTPSEKALIKRVCVTFHAKRLWIQDQEYRMPLEKWMKEKDKKIVDKQFPIGYPLRKENNTNGINKC